MQSFLKIAPLLAIAVSFTPGNCSPRPEPCRVAPGPHPNPSICLPGRPPKPITKIIPNGHHHSEIIVIYRGYSSSVTLTIPYISPPSYPKYTDEAVNRQLFRAQRALDHRPKKRQFPLLNLRPPRGKSMNDLKNAKTPLTRF